MVFGPPGIFFRKRLHELNPTLPLQSLQSLEKKKNDSVRRPPPGLSGVCGTCMWDFSNVRNEKSPSCLGDYTTQQALVVEGS